MEENSKNKKIKQIFITIIVCVIVLSSLIIFSVGFYSIFSEKNNSTVPTFAETEIKEDEELIDVDLKNLEEENLNVEQEEQDELPEQERLKQEEEKLKQEELLKQEEENLKQEELLKQEEEKNKKQQEKKKGQTQNYPYWIKVNYTANTVTIYAKDQNGNYTVPYKAMICSTGAATPTSGVYKTPQKARWGLLIGNSWGQYCTRITGQILFHSVPYDQKSEDSLHTVYYDRLGITTSLGCIRLTVADAKWIYENCPIGTSVEFYASSNPGPLGKPSAKKISGYGEPLNKWDPTDPNPNNPWHNQNNQANNNTNGNTQNNQENNNTNNNTQNNQVNNNTNNNIQNNQENNNTNNNTQNNQGNNSANNNTQNNLDNKPNVEEKPGAQKIIVPNVIGKSKEDAKKLLSGFNVVIDEISDKTKSNKVIVEQQLNPGSEVEKGTTIRLKFNVFEELYEGTVNINVKSITKYVEEKDKNNNIIAPKNVLVEVTADNKVIYSKNVLETTEKLPVNVKGLGTINIKVTIGNEQRNTKFDLNGRNQVISIY